MTIDHATLERNVLRNFFEKVCAENPQDNSISDSKIVRDAKNQLKVALRGATDRCSCAKRHYGMCEVCEASTGDIHLLRNFFRVVRNAKKHNMTTDELRDFIDNQKKYLNPPNEN